MPDSTDRGMIVVTDRRHERDGKAHFHLRDPNSDKWREITKAEYDAIPKDEGVKHERGRLDYELDLHMKGYELGIGRGHASAIYWLGKAIASDRTLDLRSAIDSLTLGFEDGEKERKA